MLFRSAAFVLIIENNQWAYSTPVSRQVPVKNLADRGVAYGIQSEIVDGNDVLAVYHASRRAVDECRAGRGPRIIEVKTMRMRGHAQHDPAEYVPPEMFAYWKERDPIARYEKYLTENRVWDEKKKAEIDARIERELDAEQKFAEDSPLPPPELAEQGVYCEDGCHAIEAQWNRSKKEVSPPQSSINPVWNVPDFGAFAPGPPADGGTSNVRTSAVPVAQKSSPSQSAPKPPGKGTAKHFAGKRGGDAPKEADPVTDVANRTPFGRGPKDKSLRQAPTPQNHKRGRR